MLDQYSAQVHAWKHSVHIVMQKMHYHVARCKCSYCRFLKHHLGTSAAHMVMFTNCNI